MIEVEHLTKRYGANIVVDDVSFTVGEGEIAVVVGTSGAGKSTLLRMINRLVVPNAGRVLIDGQDTTTVPEDELRHRIGYVIQGYGLFPHRDVAGNIATVPRLLGWDRKRIADRVEELLDLFQLDPGEFAHKFPHQLSGGQQQRVGVARALAAKPALLLMDEPFGSLDPVIRGKAQDDLLTIQRRLGTTIVLVTHDMDEAFHLGDRIAVMDQARLLQYATPAELLTHPAEAFVEQLVGTAERPFRLLSLVTVQDAVEQGHAEGEPLSLSDSLRDALSQLIWRGREALPVAGPSGAPVGRISIAGILRHGRSLA
jgi:osmoprotectant transport system ATP-binding protein